MSYKPSFRLRWRLFRHKHRDKPKKWVIRIATYFLPVLSLLLALQANQVSVQSKLISAKALELDSNDRSQQFQLTQMKEQNQTLITLLKTNTAELATISSILQEQRNQTSYLGRQVSISSDMQTQALNQSQSRDSADYMRLVSKMSFLVKIDRMVNVSFLHNRDHSAQMRTLSEMFVDLQAELSNPVLLRDRPLLERWRAFTRNTSDLMLALSSISTDSVKLSKVNEYSTFYTDFANYLFKNYHPL